MPGAIDKAYVEIIPLMTKFKSQVKAGIDGALPGVTAAGKLHGTTYGTQLGQSAQAAASRQGGAVATGFNQRVHSGLKTGMLVAGGIVATAFATMAAGAVAMGVKTASNLEQATVAFTNMLGSASQAKAMLADLQKLAAATPFEFPQLVDATRKLLAFGISAKDVRSYLIAIGDATAAMGGGPEMIDALTRAFGQMSARGRVSMQEINQMTEAGIPALRILADQYGVTVGQMTKMIESGSVMSAEALPKLRDGIEKGTKSVAKMGGMMEAQSKTMAGLFSTLKDNVNMALMNMVGPVVPYIKSALSGLIGATQGWSKSFAKVFGDAANAVSGLVTLITTGNISDKLVKAFPGEKMAPFVGTLYRIRDGIATMVTQAKPLLDSIGRTFGDLADKAGSILGPRIGTFAAAVRDNLVPALSNMWETVKPIITTLGDFALKVADVAFQVGTKLVEALKPATQWLKDNRDIVKDLAIVVGTLWAAYKGWDVVDKAAKAFSGLKTAMTQSTLATRINKIETGLATAAHWAHTAAVSVAHSTLVTWLGVKLLEAGAWIRSTVATIGHTVAMWTHNAARAVSSGQLLGWLSLKAMEAVAWVKSTAATIGHTVALWTHSAARATVNTLTTIFLAIKNSEAVAWLKSAAGTVVHTAALIAHATWMGIVKVATVVWTGVQWALNAALNANPIGLIIGAIVLLVGAIVLAWNKSAAFRTIVMAVWGAIWSFIKGFADFFVTYVWPIIKQVIDFIVQYFQFMWGIVKFVFGLIWTIVKGVADFFMTYIWPVIKVAIDGIVAGFNWLWGVVSNVWTWIKNIINAVWSWIYTYIVVPMKNELQVIGNAFHTMWGVISSAWNNMKNGLYAGWSWVVNNVFNPIKNFITVTLPNAFSNGVKAIGDFFNGIKEFAKKPVNWVIKNVINKIIGIVNTIAGVFNPKWKIALVPEIGAATGGSVGGLGSSYNPATVGRYRGAARGGYAAPYDIRPGGSLWWGAGTQTSDDVYLRGSRDEYMIRARAAKLLGRPALDYMNRYGKMPYIPGFLYGGSIDAMITLMRRSGIPFSVTSAYRPGDPGYHGSRHAVDVADSQNNMDNLAAFLMRYSGRIMELIHSPSWFVKNGKVVGASYYGDDIVLQHFNHVHLAMSIAQALAALGQNVGQGIIGSLADFAQFLLDKFKGVLDVLPNIPGAGIFRDIISNVPVKVLDTITTSMKNWFASSGAGWGTSEIQAYAASLMPQYGWAQSQMNSLIPLWNRESGWMWNATNPSSGAYGIPQALPGSKMAAAGADWKTNPKTQVRWGLSYIYERYGAPSLAYAMWLTRNPHWYSKGGPIIADQGAVIPPGHLMLNSGNRKELATPEGFPIHLAPEDIEALAVAVATALASTSGGTTELGDKTIRALAAELGRYTATSVGNNNLAMARAVNLRARGG